MINKWGYNKKNIKAGFYNKGRFLNIEQIDNK